MNMIGYAPHRRSGSAVVGMTHMSTHTAFRVAEALGLYTGWLHCDGEQPQLEGIEAREPVWVVLAELFVEQRVANTEGVVSGSLTFGSAVQANGTPPSDRSLQAWTESGNRPWMQIVDNENVFFGGLNEAAIDQLLCWFLCARPLTVDWRECGLAPAAAKALRSGLFEHGWSRNADLVMTGWRSTVDLWAGIHALSPLEHEELERLSTLQRGVRLTLKGGEWQLKPLIDEECPLDDETGRATPRLSG
ncbi:MAG: hypothetical protein PF961_23895 [Planctomycetota bacterium]|nr:hypothetical protein [Planctomycetota bacterium]